MAATALDDGKRFLSLYPWMKTGDDPIALIEDLVREASKYQTALDGLRGQFLMALERAEKAEAKVKRMDALLATLVHERRLSRKKYREALNGELSVCK